jgi:hypothetical protein
MTVGSIGRSLELFFIDGKPDGTQTAEMFNWTWHVLLNHEPAQGNRDTFNVRSKEGCPLG